MKTLTLTLALLLAQMGDKLVESPPPRVSQPEPSEAIKAACRNTLSDIYVQCVREQACEKPLLPVAKQDACERCWDDYQLRVDQCAGVGSEAAGIE